MTGWRPVRASVSAGFVALIVAVQATIGLVAVRQPTYAVLATAALVCVLVGMWSPLTVAALALPATIASWRLGGGGIDLSYADAVLVISILVALPYAPWSSKTLQRLLGATFIYTTILAVTIARVRATRHHVGKTTKRATSHHRSPPRERVKQSSVRPAARASAKVSLRE